MTNAALPSAPLPQHPPHPPPVSVVLHLAVVHQRHGRRLPAGDAHHHLAMQGARHLPGGRLVARAARAQLARAVEAPGKHLEAREHVTKTTLINAVSRPVICSSPHFWSRQVSVDLSLKCQNFSLTVVLNLRINIEQARAVHPIKTMTDGAKFQIFQILMVMLVSVLIHF